MNKKSCAAVGGKRMVCQGIIKISRIVQKFRRAQICASRCRWVEWRWQDCEASIAAYKRRHLRKRLVTERL